MLRYCPINHYQSDNCIINFDIWLIANLYISSRVLVPKKFKENEPKIKFFFRPVYQLQMNQSVWVWRRRTVNQSHDHQLFSRCHNHDVHLCLIVYMSSPFFSLTAPGNLFVITVEVIQSVLGFIVAIVTATNNHQSHLFPFYEMVWLIFMFTNLIYSVKFMSVNF